MSPASDQNRAQLVATPASEIQREEIEWLVPGRIPVGLVTVLAGVGGLGKSQLTCRYAADLSTGKLGEPFATLIATAEDTPSTTVIPRLQALEADLNLIRFLTVKTKEGDEDGIELPRDTPALMDAIRDLGARLLVVDPLVAHLPGHIDTHRDQSVRRALAPLYRLAKETNCAVIAVLHLNKAQGLAPLQRLGGSTGFGNAARSVLLLDRDPDDPDGEGGKRRVLAHIKCNVAPLAPSLLYSVEPIVLPAKGNEPMVKTSRLELIGESEHDGRSLLGDEETRTAIADAKGFLREHLGDGRRHQAKDVTRAARENGINERTLQRARKAIGAEAERVGFGKDGAWEWWLGSPLTTTSSQNSANPHEHTKASDTSTCRLWDEAIDDNSPHRRPKTTIDDRISESVVFDGKGFDDDIPF